MNSNAAKATLHKQKTKFSSAEEMEVLFSNPANLITILSGLTVDSRDDEVRKRYNKLQRTRFSEFPVHPVKDWSGTADAAPLRLKLNISYLGGLFVLSAQSGAVHYAAPLTPL